MDKQRKDFDMKKIISILLTLIMLVTLVSCNAGGDGTDAPDTSDTSNYDVPDQPDYSQKKFKTYSDDGETFFSISEISAFIDDNAGIRLSGLNSKFAFSANCEGDVSLEILTKAVSETANIATLKISVDGGEAKNMSLIYLKQNLKIATGLERGTHTFVIEKTSGGDLFRIDSITLCGEMLEPPLLSKENGVYVEVLAPVGGDDEYSSFNIYVQTTHASGDYFIKYPFVYEYDDIDETLTWSTGPNTGSNRMNYRIITAQIVKKTGEKTFSKVYDILQSGEISLAIRESGAGDFVGGLHGDENLKSVSLILDGNTEIELYHGTAAFYNCTTVDFKQSTSINRCHTTDTKVMNHNQHYLIDTNGIKLLQQVEWLTDDFKLAPETYLQMFTLRRTNSANADDFLTTRLNLLNENGGTIKSLDLTTVDPGTGEGVEAVASADARYAEYFGDEKGIYAKAGFQFVDNSCKLSNARIVVRKYGDSKWYPSFSALQGNPKTGDIWTINSIYYIDYNPAD